jgi:hypothetical protein
MKFSARIFATVIMLVSLKLLAISAQAQTWTPRLYGCIEGGQSYAEVNLRDYLVQTPNPSLNAAIYEDVVQLDNLFGVRVSVYFPNDDLTEARFTPEKNRELILRDDGNPDAYHTGSILISRGFIEREFQETNGSKIAMSAVVSHEFAHAMQYKNSFPYGEGVRRELHADFMAGWYVAQRCRCGGEDPEAAFWSFLRKGDNRGFFDPKHHGTGQERAAMMAAGYAYNIQANDDSAVNAYNAGLRIVSSF